MAYLTEAELDALGFLSIGENVKISCRASIYGADQISIGSHVRIDDFCILSAGKGGISIGSFIHVAAYSSLIGHARIKLMDFSNISSRVSIYSSSDDYSGEWMTNPTLPEEYTGVQHLPVNIGRHVIIGAGSIVLPGGVLEEGVSIGALSMVKGHCTAFGIYAGIPVKLIGKRKKNILDLEKKLMTSMPH